MIDIRRKAQPAHEEAEEAAAVEDPVSAGIDGEAGEAAMADAGEEAAAAAETSVGKKSWTEEQVRELKDQALRLMADMENLRRRHEREMDEARKYAMTSFARDLLEVVDNLGRALKAVPVEERAGNDFLETLVTGVEMTQRTLLATFEKHRIQRVEPHRGEKFDHNRHQAMYEVPTSEWPQGSIADVVQPGYVLAERLLRPAMVGVAKAVPGGGDTAGTAADTAGGGTVDTSA